MINLRFVTCDDAISAGIRFAQYGFWASHVETLTPEGKLLGAHWQDGVQERDHNYDAGKFSKELYVSLPVDDKTAKDFYEWCKAQIGKPYDITAIAGFLARRNWREDDSWFCSELIMSGLERVHWCKKLALDVEKIMPRVVLNIVSSQIDIWGN